VTPKSRILCAAFAAILSALPAFSQARVGDSAPTFTATDSHGKPQALDQYKGKFVVLEWHNQGCPYTRKHYESGNMQELQQEWTGKGVTWFTVISSAPGEQGYMTPDRENSYVAQVHATPTAVLLDSDGKLGRLYGARTTPQMFVIDPQGKLAALVKADYALGQSIGIQHTPTIWVVTNSTKGTPFVEVVDRTKLYSMIDDALAETKGSAPERAAAHHGR